MASAGSFHGTWEQSGPRSQQYNAHIQNHYHRSSKNKRITAIPVSTVPFLRDPNFVERSEYRKITEKLLSGKTRVALTGFGGAGKSQLAIEYCYRARQNSSDCWVFWIHASSLERLDAGIREVADALQLPGRHDPNADVLRLVETWLRGSGKQWLLVLDNADLEKVLFTPANGVNIASPGAIGKRTIDHLAIPSCGQTILTTRHKKVGLQFVDECDINKAGFHHDAMNVEKLVNELGFVPLAIAHAAAFISSQVPPCSIRTYLNKLEKAIKSDASLLTANYNELRRDAEASNSVIITWQVSFEHIQQIRPSAADRLSLMSCYDHRSIPRTLVRLRKAAESKSTFSASQSSYPSPEFKHITPVTSKYAIADTALDVELEGDIAMLYEFYLISISVEDGDLEIHPLVQLAARSWLESQGTEDHWTSTGIENLWYALPKEDMENSPQWRILFPHVQLALASKLHDKASGLFLANICHEAVYFIAFTSGFPASETWARRCWAEKRRHLGKDHIETLWADLHLAKILRILGKQEEARVIFERCLILATKSSDPSREWRSFLANCLQYTGNAELSRGNLVDAEIHLRKALEVFHELSEYAHVPECVESLKDVLLRQGKHSLAEGVCSQALKECTKHFGSEHGYTLDVTTSLADVFYNKGDLAEALEMHNSVLEAYKHIYGFDHFYALEVMIEIAHILRAQEKVQEAANLLQQVHRLSSDRYGEESMVALENAQNYARALKKMGEFAQALDVMKVCAASTQRTLGPDHPETLKRARLAAKLERKLQKADDTRQREDVRFIHGIRLEQHAKMKEKMKCAVQ